MKSEDKGNKNLPLDGAFLNEAWGSMEALLDRNMPIKRRRRFIAWWPLIGVFVLASISGVLYFGLQGSRSFEKAAIISEKTSRDNETSTSTDKVEIKDDIVQDGTIGKKEIIINTTLTGNAAHDESEATGPASNGAKPSLKRSNPLPKDQLNGLPDLPIKESEILPAIIKDKRADDKASPPFAFQNEQNLKAFPIKLIDHSLASLTFPQHFDLDLTDPVPFSKNKRLAAIEINGGIHSGTKGLSGFVLSGGLDFKVHPRWSLKPELGYAFLNASSGFPFKLGRQSDEVLFASDLDSLEDVNLSGVFNAVGDEVELKGFHSFTFGIMAQHNLSRKWKVFAGPSLAYAIGIRASSPSLTFDSFSTTAGAVGQITIPVSDGIQKIDPAISAGLAFAPNNRLNIQLRYAHHFADLTKSGYFSGQGKLNHSGVQLQLGYRFGRE